VVEEFIQPSVRVVIVASEDGLLVCAEEEIIRDVGVPGV